VNLLAAESEDFKEAAADFLRGLLQPDPRKRMTAQEALGHRFLTDSFSDVAADALPAAVEEDQFVVKTTLDRMVLDTVGKVCNAPEAAVMPADAV
jgi:serine/threonine protein kinase